MSDELIAFNGVDGETGGYLFPEMTLGEVAAMARGEKIEPQQKAFLDAKRAQQEGHYGLIAGLDCRKLEESGWGVIFAPGAGEGVRQALRPLLDLRREQATKKDERLYREYSGDSGYRHPETKFTWTNRNGAGGAGAVDPKKMPYYLLIVGDPEAIPYRFQHQLDVQYAVGRIHFDTDEEYARYAQSVVAAETGELRLPRRASFFAVANPDDKATRFSSTLLAEPLAEFARTDKTNWTVDSIAPQDATHARLAQLLGGGQMPALLFTASHGMGFRSGHSRQLAHTGAIVCQDWPGPNWKGDPRNFYFAGEDLDPNARLAGLIAMFFACFGAGSPRHNEFAIAGKGDKQEIAPRPLMSELPRRMLAHPKGGALAVVGHVDRAWDLSFRWKKSGPQIEAFQSTVKQLMEGFPVGAALEFFNMRYAELSSLITSQVQAIHDDGFRPDEMELASLWTANNDARNYAIIGDPAVRLPVNFEGEDVPLAWENRTPVIVTSAPAPAAAPVPVPAAGTPPAAAAAATTTPAPAPSTPATMPTSPAMPPTPPEPPTPAAAATAAMLSAASKPAPPPPPRVLPPAAENEVEFGFMDSFQTTSSNITASLQRLVERIGASLERTAQNVITLEVTTYASDRITEVRYENGRLTGARLRAFTRLGLDGDMQVCVPENEAGAVDDALWKIHCEAVDRAIANRGEMVRLAASAAASLLEALKK